MSDLTAFEKLKLERLFRMESGYVLNFSDRTFFGFVLETTGRDIDDLKYGGLSKAKRLRNFWLSEPNHVVAKLTQAMVEYDPSHGFTDDDGGMLREECRRIVIRLAQGTPVPELDALTPGVDEPDFEVIAKQVRDAVEKNEPEAGLDRLHTFVVKFVRACCEERGISCPQDKPLHSIFGEYVKRLRQRGQIESEMTERILKSSISVLEAFNDVRNNQSLAHDNRTLSYDESLLIFNHVASLIRFIRSIEAKAKVVEKKFPRDAIDDIPF